MHTHSQPCPSYQRHRPEETPTYQVIHDHLSAFIAQRESEGRALPRYVLDEFDAYLRCGILSHGFIRLQCTGCKEEKIVAFSCKKRGFCPSCCGKRMVEAAAHLVDNVLPMAPYRQFVISFPTPLRYWLQTNRKLLSRVQGIVIGELHQHYKDKAFRINGPAPGTISFNQRWGSALNLNPHMHVLALDGVYARHEGVPRFYKSQPISDCEVGALIEGIARKVSLNILFDGKPLLFDHFA